MDILPFDEWVAGTLQNSVSANNNALRSEALAAAVISKTTTAQPGSPIDGGCYIIPAGATGTQWATFTEGSLAYFRGGTWYELTAYEGLLKVVAGVVEVYNGSAWEAAGGGGGGGSTSITVQESGVDVGLDVTTVNFTGSGVDVTETSPGVVEVNIIGGGGGGGGGGESSFTGWDALMMSQPGGSSATGYGIGAPSPNGTNATRAISSSSIIESLPRIAYTRTASTTATSGVRGSSGSYLIVKSATTAGFYYETMVSLEDGATTASHRSFAGLWASNSANTDVNPSTLTDIIGLGYDSADTQVQIMHNDGSGTATKVALGAGFPKPTASNQSAYKLQLTSDTSGQVSYVVTDIISGNTASGTISTNLPTAAMNWHSWASAGGTSTAIAHVWFYSRIRIPA